MNTRKPVTLQNKWLFLTYNDSEDKIAGPAILLNMLAEQLKKYTPYYGIAGQEHAPSTGTKHFHIVICCRQQVRSRNGEVLEIKGVKPHVEKIGNNLKRVIQYVMKEGNIAEMNKNECPVKLDLMSREEKNQLMLSGDLQKEFMKGTVGAIEVIRAYKIRSLFQTYSPPDPFKKKLILWFKGETGEGKTRKAVEIATKYEMDYWLTNNDLRWFDGYQGQPIAIIDDFRRNMLGDWNFLLRLLDGYSLLVPIKGGFVRWSPQIIIITTPATPNEAFQWVTRDGDVQNWDHQEQLERRLTYEDERQVYEFPLWEEEERRLIRTINHFLGREDEQEMVEEDLELSPILPEPSQIDEA